MVRSLPQRSANLTIEKTAHRVIVTDNNRDYVHVLNDRAATVLEQCDGTHTCNQIAQIVAGQTHVPYERIASEVAHLVASFADLALIESAVPN
ncbi:MAG: PqqD family protein [Candidatus Baltobacteraceae bacterium]